MTNKIKEMEKLLKEAKLTDKDLTSFIKVSDFLSAAFAFSESNAEQRSLFVNIIETNKNIIKNLLNKN